MDYTQNVKSHIIDVLAKNFDQVEVDGWSIMFPNHFIKMGFDKKVLKEITRRQHSGEGKFQLYDNDDKPVKYLDGIHYLDFLKWVVRHLSPDFSSDKMGRGFQARELYEEIKNQMQKRKLLNET
tara:strand:+ start:166 stop:537 length:372 start_codon:yes stop_codon:yes gene_type:complete